MAATPSPRIRILPDHLASQIAAGEVVERPASVVKELVENSLDAGASSITIDLEAGGRRRIGVGDDGSGMGRQDALLAFDRHATSKITTFEDLERVGTLGFRGEALASIASVARVELLSHDGEEGTRVRIEGGRVRVAEPGARARGTTIEIEALFFNVPARRKFLKSAETELRRSLEIIQGIAIAHPAVGFRVTHDGREVLRLPANEDPIRRIGRLFGEEFAKHLEPIAPSAGASAWSGWIGDPTTAKGRRHFVWINGRVVRDRAVMAVFYRSVREAWRSEDVPALFLFAALDPLALDVNVHPQKAEVRFRDASVLADLEGVLLASLARGRGVESAEALRAPGDVLAVPLAWAGLGGRGVAPSEIRESIAQTLWAPLERPPVVVPLSGRGTPALHSFRLLGQYKGTLILLEGVDGLYLVDQHVAHERILYERLRRALAAARPSTQAFLEPRWLTLAAPERLRLEALAPHLEALGFGLSPMSGGILALTSAPPELDGEGAVGLLTALAAGNEGEGEMPPDQAVIALRRRLLDAAAASQACRAAIKMHQPMSAEAMEALVSELFRAEHPYACPHGRPTILALTDADLERRFGRR